jgi:hypothetical protein
MSNRTPQFPDLSRPRSDLSKMPTPKLASLAVGALVPACVLFASLVLPAGCASKRASQPPSRPREGMAEYRQIAIEAQQAMRAAMNSLATVSAQSNACPPAVLAAFSNEVRRVQVGSFKIRARSQAMQARGDAYFERWNENLARISDPEVRALAQRQRPALQEGFRKIKMWSKTGHEAFQPFLAGLRMVRNALEKDPAGISADSTQGFIMAARTSGQEVESSLASITRQLDSMIAMVTPSGSPSQSQKTQ